MNAPKIATAQDISIELAKALNLPEHTCEFTVAVSAGDFVKVSGMFYTTTDKLEKFERVFKDKAELI